MLDTNFPSFLTCFGLLDRSFERLIPTNSNVTIAPRRLTDSSSLLPIYAFLISIAAIIARFSSVVFIVHVATGLTSGMAPPPMDRWGLLMDPLVTHHQIPSRKGLVAHGAPVPSPVYRVIVQMPVE